MREILPMTLLIAMTLRTLSCTEAQLPFWNCSVLSLLNVLPLYHERAAVGEFDAVWDRGLDVTPAGHLAVEQINNRSDILPDHKLKLIDIDSEACGLNVISKGIVNTFRELVDLNRTCIVGVVGLFCSQVTNIISPIVSHPSIGGYIQIAASTTPVHRANDSEEKLFHIVEASSVFNEVTVSMMQAFNWTRIGIVYNSLGLFSESVANDFINKIQSVGLHLVSQVPISNSFLNIHETLDTFRDEDSRISYWSLSYKHSAPLLCEAYHRNLRWPGYVYILREPTLENILEQETLCSKQQMLLALEGAFLLHYRLYTENDTQLFSGWSFGEYKERYAHTLQTFASRTNREANENDYANVLYDQVWAFGLALNNFFALTHTDNKITQNMSSTLKHELRSVSFQGATGWINFGVSQESRTTVDVFQVINGTPKLIGIYDQLSQDIIFTDSAPQHRGVNIPKDMFEIDYKLLPLWLGGCIATAQGVLFCIISANLIFIIYWKEEREIKATSPFLSILMIAGCYILCIGPILLVVLFTTYNTVLENMGLLTFLCVFKSFTMIGLDFILATLLLRMLRIQHIFQATQMTMMSDYWMDKYLLVYALIVCTGKLILLIIWNSIDPIHSVFDRIYIPESSGKLPHYVTTMKCTSDSSRIWLVITTLYSGVLLLFVVILAIMTRHIKNDMYKDTKKVNFFIFLVILVLAITVPLQLVYNDLNNQTIALVAEWLAFFSVPLLCQICLYFPKTLPLVMKVLRRA